MSPSVDLSPPHSASTVARAGQACGLKTAIGTVDGSVAKAIRRLMDWIATFRWRLAIDVASPSWARAARYAGSIAVPPNVSWNSLNSTWRHARPNGWWG